MKIRIGGRGLYFAFLIGVSLGLGNLSSRAADKLPPSFSPGSSAISPWVHRDSGFSFPANVAGFSRGDANQYDQSGRDVSVGYYHYQPQVVATFYVYPLGDYTQQDELLRRQKELTDKYPDAKLVSTGTTDVTSKKIPVMIATYAIPEMFDQKNEPMQSLLLIGKRDDRYIEYRISYPISGGKPASDAARQFLADFAWP